MTNRIYPYMSRREANYWSEQQRRTREHIERERQRRERLGIAEPGIEIDHDVLNGLPSRRLDLGRALSRWGRR